MYKHQDDELIRAQFMITVGHDDWLDKMSSLNNLSRSQIVRAALDFLKAQPEAPLQLKYGRRNEPQEPL